MKLFDKEIKYVEKYQSECNFRFIEANEQWIVYRSEVSSHTTIYHPKLVPTIDLILVGTMFFEWASRFEKPVISRPNDEKSFELAKKFDKGFNFLESDERVYKIESQYYSLYVVAAHLWIHEHNCQFGESFIDNFNYNNYLQEYVESWVKIK